MSICKRHAALWRALAIHLKVNTRTMATFEKRLCHGAVFFHVHMPSLGKDLERGLQGRFELTSEYFSTQAHSALPKFLYEMFIKIFHKNGYVRDEPHGIQDLRQLLMMHYKFETDFTSELLEKSNADFIARDQLVKNKNWPSGMDKVRAYFVSLLPDDPWDIKPHHSNGASATSITNVGKRSVRRYIPSLMKHYPPTLFFNSHSHSINWSQVNKTVIGHPHSKITQVPKDSRGPRTICMEPHELMFVQKGLQDYLYDHIESHSPAKGYVNFTDQSINRRLAYVASIDRSLVTIDLKDASDMVSWDLIRYLVTPEWYVALKATRSTHARVGDELVELKKYAPMGSALCFPIEAMLFWSICKTLAPEVWVYGDDIIVGIDYAPQCIAALQSYGLLINLEKTLSDGFFRESCGGDYYKGVDITYLKCKSYDGLSYIPFCNLIAERYGQRLATIVLSHYENEMGPVMRHPLSERENPKPFVFYTDSLSSADVFFRRRWNKDLQKFEKRWLHASALPERKNKTKLEQNYQFIDDDALFDWFTSVNTDKAPCSDHAWKMRERELFDLLRNESSMMPVERKPLQQSVYTVTKYAWGDAYSIQLK